MRPETPPFQDRAGKILSETPLVVLERRGGCVGFYTRQKLENIWGGGDVSLVMQSLPWLGHEPL